jgi:hypothetical protein
MTPEKLVTLLRPALRHTANAYWLAQYAIGLVEVVCPMDRHPSLSDLQRAAMTELTLRKVIRSMDATVAQFLLIALGLTSETANLTAGKRLELAASTCCNVKRRRGNERRKERVTLLAIALCDHLTSGDSGLTAASDRSHLAPVE